jgi:hypothetical protein
VRIFFGDLIFDGRGNSNLALAEKVHRARTFLFRRQEKILQRLSGRTPTQSLGNIKTIFVVKSAANIREADNFVALPSASSPPPASRRFRIAMTTRQPVFNAGFASALSQQIITPRPVASRLLPTPNSMGLPVTTAVVAWPRCIA